MALSNRPAKGGRLPYVRGKEVELYLVHILQERGYLAVRAPASGKAKRIFYPDVLAVKHLGSCHRVLIFDVKYRAERLPITFHAERVWETVRFARLAGADPYIAVYVAADRRWHVFPYTVLATRIEGGVRTYTLQQSAYHDSMDLNELLEKEECTPKLIREIRVEGVSTD